MRITPVLAFIGASALSVSALAAPLAPVSVSEDGNTVNVRGQANSVHRLTPGEAEFASGSFRLSDGRELRLTHRREKLFVELDGRREELLRVSDKGFVSRMTGMEVALDEMPFAQTIAVTENAR